jgi:uncharacterized protein (TIGR00251 family)
MQPVTATIDVLVKLRASRNSIDGFREGVLVVRLNAPPVEGAANKALVKLLAGKAGVAKGKVRIVSGEKNRTKILQFEGITVEELKERLR